MFCTYLGPNLAVMSEILEVKDNDLVTVSAIHQKPYNHDHVSLDKVIQESLKWISLSNHHRCLLLALLLEYSGVFQFWKISWVVLMCWSKINCCWECSSCLSEVSYNVTTNESKIHALVRTWHVTERYVFLHQKVQGHH